MRYWNISAKSEDFKRLSKKEISWLSTAGLCLDVLNNEFVVISFREKQRKMSLQTSKIKQCDSIRNHVERINFFKNKIKEQLKIFILFHRRFDRMPERNPQPVTDILPHPAYDSIRQRKHIHVGCIFLQLLLPFCRLLHVGNAAAAQCHTKGNSVGSHCCRILPSIAEGIVALPCHLFQY